MLPRKVFVWAYAIARDSVRYNIVPGLSGYRESADIVLSAHCVCHRGRIQGKRILASEAKITFFFGKQYFLIREKHLRRK